MTLSVNQHVWKILQSDLAIQKDLARKTINMRALAKYLIKKYDLRVSLDSIISAIRRFQSDETFEEEEEALLHIFRDAHISTKNNISVMTTNVAPGEFHRRFCKTTGHHNHHGMRMVTGTQGIKLIVSQKEQDEFKGLFTKEEVESTEHELSEISVIVNDKAAHTKGVIGRLTSELALSNINIHELIVSIPEFLVYVKHKDLVKAHDSLLKLSKEA
jgi:aspartokinase